MQTHSRRSLKTFLCVLNMCLPPHKSLQPLVGFFLFVALTSFGCETFGPPAPIATLLDKQNAFAGLAGRLVHRAQAMGYQVSLGEAWRTPEQAKFIIEQVLLNAEKGIGIASSLHIKRLALDLNLFHNGKYLNASSDYEALGKWWEAQSTAQGPNPVRCRWGGRFKKPDGNHFSIEHEGIQ